MSRSSYDCLETSLFLNPENKLYETTIEYFTGAMECVWLVGTLSLTWRKRSEVRNKYWKVAGERNGLNAANLPIFRHCGSGRRGDVKRHRKGDKPIGIRNFDFDDLPPSATFSIPSPDPSYKPTPKGSKKRSAPRIHDSQLCPEALRSRVRGRKERDHPTEAKIIV